MRIYPNHADDPRALALIHGRKVTLRLYGSQGQPIDDQDEAIRSELARIGIDVKVISLPFDQLIQALGNPKAPYDMVNIGWGPDFVDPYDYLDILLNGERITARNNVEWAQFTDRTFERRLDRAALLTGPPRFAAYAGIDRDVMREGAPLAPMYHSNVRELVSTRVGCYTFVPAMQAMSLAAACIR